MIRRWCRFRGHPYQKTVEYTAERPTEKLYVSARHCMCGEQGDATYRVAPKYTSRTEGTWLH